MAFKSGILKLVNPSNWFADDEEETEDEFDEEVEQTDVAVTEAAQEPITQGKVFGDGVVDRIFDHVRSKVFPKLFGDFQADTDLHGEIQKFIRGILQGVADGWREFLTLDAAVVRRTKEQVSLAIQTFDPASVAGLFSMRVEEAKATFEAAYKPLRRKMLLDEETLKRRVKTLQQEVQQSKLDLEDLAIEITGQRGIEPPAPLPFYKKWGRGVVLVATAMGLDYFVGAPQFQGITDNKLGGALSIALSGGISISALLWGMLRRLRNVHKTAAAVFRRTFRTNASKPEADGNIYEGFDKERNREVTFHQISEDILDREQWSKRSFIVIVSVLLGLRALAVMVNPSGSFASLSSSLGLLVVGIVTYLLELSCAEKYDRDLLVAYQLAKEDLELLEEDLAEVQEQLQTRSYETEFANALTPLRNKYEGEVKKAKQQAEGVPGEEAKTLFLAMHTVLANLQGALAAEISVFAEMQYRILTSQKLVGLIVPQGSQPSRSGIRAEFTSMISGMGADLFDPQFVAEVRGYQFAKPTLPEPEAASRIMSRLDPDIKAGVRAEIAAQEARPTTAANNTGFQD